MFSQAIQTCANTSNTNANTPPTWFMCIKASPVRHMETGEGSQPSLWSILSGRMVLPSDKCTQLKKCWWECVQIIKACRVRHQRGGAEGSQASLWSIGGRFSVAAAGRMDLQSASFLSLLQHNTQHCKGVSEVHPQS